MEEDEYAPISLSRIGYEGVALVEQYTVCLTVGEVRIRSMMQNAVRLYRLLPYYLGDFRLPVFFFVQIELFCELPTLHHTI